MEKTFYNEAIDAAYRLINQGDLVQAAAILGAHTPFHPQQSQAYWNNVMQLCITLIENSWLKGMQEDTALKSISDAFIISQIIKDESAKWIAISRVFTTLSQRAGDNNAIRLAQRLITRLPDDKKAEMIAKFSN